MAWKGTIPSIVVTSDTAYTTIATIPIQEGAESFWAEVLNTAHYALSGFRVQFRPYADGNFYTLATLASDFTTPMSGVILNSSTNPTVLAKSGGVAVGVKVKAVNAVRLQAKVATVSDTYVSGGWQQR